MNKIITILLVLASFISLGQGATPNLRADLELYLKLEEAIGSSVVINQTGNGDATSFNTNEEQTGRVGDCHDFNGSTSYINTNLTTHYAELSFSAWIYLQSYGEGELGRLFDKRNSGGSQVLLFYCSGGVSDRLELYVEFSTTGGQWKANTSSLNTGEWYHICLTYNSGSTAGNPILYMNGLSVAFGETSTPSGTVTTNTDNYFIGNRGDGGRTFDGLIDEVMIYKRLLSALEARQLYNSDSGLLYVRENFKKNYNYETFISYFIQRDYFVWINGANG